VKARREALVKLGYPEDYTSPKYSCPDCSDSGFIGGEKMCHCFREALIKERVAASGMGRLIETQSFDNFSLDVYQNDQQKGVMESIYNSLKKYAMSFSPQTSQSLFFVGDTGLGKTHLSSAIAKEVIDKGFSVVYETAPGMMLRLEKEHFEHNSQSDSNKYLESDLLIIDDLGAEYSNRATISFLYNIINTRILNCLPMIISTNLDPKELEKRYERRMSSRLLGEFTVFAFKGCDMRMAKLNK
jgi:DNA replication protein DnaC